METGRVSMILDSSLSELRTKAALYDALLDKGELLEEQVEELECTVESLEESINEYEQEAAADLDENTRLQHGNAKLALRVERLLWEKQGLGMTCDIVSGTLSAINEIIHANADSALRAATNALVARDTPKLLLLNIGAAMGVAAFEAMEKQLAADQKEELDFIAEMKATSEADCDEDCGNCAPNPENEEG